MSPMEPMDPIDYVGPEDGITYHSVKKLNDYLLRGLPTDRVAQLALSDLFTLVGQLEMLVMQLQRAASRESVIGSSTAASNGLKELMSKMDAMKAKNVGN
ncbi:hypothetical protein [Mycobacteroides chelonae]|nr:hypothetical protein [Mycobacteroides chelonae]